MRSVKMAAFALGFCAAASMTARAAVDLTGTIRDFHGVHATQTGGGIGTSTDFDQFNFGPLVDLQEKFASNTPVTITDLQAVLAVVNQPGGVPAEYLPRFIPNVPAFPGFAGGTLDLQNPPFPIPALNAQDQTRKVEAGIVNDDLSIDGTPTYKGASPAPLFKSTHDADHFNTWFHTTTNVNLAKAYTLTLEPVAGKPGVFGFQADGTSDTQDGVADGGFYPLDNDLAGNDGVDTNGAPHNFSFTLQAHTTGVYHAGQNQKFSFLGDDDLWIFINGKLALDLGGVHQSITGEINLDTLAAQLGLENGKAFQFGFFFAERNQFISNLKIETSIEFGETPDDGGGGGPVVPLPPAVWSALSLLAGLGLLKLWYSRKLA